MPISLPNLDDRTFDDLMKEAKALIPSYAPEWTNHNPSDPGITLVELFAYLTEMLIYRLNRVTEENVCAFLTLLDTVERTPTGRVNEIMETRTSEGSKTQSVVLLTEAIREVVLNLREPDRAVTGEDFENLALKADSRVVRARGVARRNLEGNDPQFRTLEKPGHFSVIIVPASEDEAADPDNQDSNASKPPSVELLKKVGDYLDERRLLTTRVHVVGPQYVKVSAHVIAVIKPDVKRENAPRIVKDALRRFFHPYHGWSDGQGWPFGRNVYVSEVYQLLDGLPEIDYVADITLKRDSQGALDVVELLPDELVDFSIADNDIEIKSPVDEINVDDRKAR